MPGLDEYGARAVGERAVRPVVRRPGDRPVRVVARVHRSQDGGGGGTASSTDGRGGRAATDGAVQAQPMRLGRGMPGKPRVPHGRWPRRVQPVPVRGRLQGRRGVALSIDRALVRARAHVQRAEGLREGVPVHGPGLRTLPAAALRPGPGVLAGRPADR